MQTNYGKRNKIKGIGASFLGCVTETEKWNSFSTTSKRYVSKDAMDDFYERMKQSLTILNEKDKHL